MQYWIHFIFLGLFYFAECDYNKRLMWVKMWRKLSMCNALKLEQSKKSQTWINYVTYAILRGLIFSSFRLIISKMDGCET